MKKILKIDELMIEPEPKKRRVDDTPENGAVSLAAPANPKPRSKATNPLEIFKKCKQENRPVMVAGPMVRYSKLPFRELMGEYGADIIYSPMILAREFVRSSNARTLDLTTNTLENDRCFVIQVGANNVTDMLRVVEMVRPYCDAIGLNCGCPVKEQVREGIGAALMSDADKVARFVLAVKEKYGDTVLMETKIRIHNDILKTIEFVKKVEAAGVDWITIHGRTKDTRSLVAANIDAIRDIRKHIKRVPVIANGDYFKPEDLNRITNHTGCDGVMAVRGIMANPAVFQGFQETPWGAIERFIDHCVEYGLHYRVMQHQVSCMFPTKGLPELASRLKQINETASFVELIDFLDENFDLRRRGDEGFGENRSILQACKFEIKSTELTQIKEPIN